MAAYLDSVPFSGIIRIRDMMYSIADPYRLDQGDVSFDSPDTVKAAMRRAIDENKTHYLQTTGVPRLRELLAAKLRDKNGIPVDDAEQVLVTNGGIHGVYLACHSLLEPGDEVLVPDPSWPPATGNILAARAVPVFVSAARIARLAVRPRRARVEDRPEDARALPQLPAQPDRRRADARRSRPHRGDRARTRPVGVFGRGLRGRRLRRRAASASRRCPGCTSARSRCTRSARSYAMTGLRLGYVAIHDPAIRDRAKKVLFYTASNVASVVQFGGIGALEGPQDCIEEFRTELRARRDLFYAGIGRMEHGPFSGKPPAGRVLRVPEDRSGMERRRRVDVVAVVADDGVSDQERTHRLRARRRFRRTRRRLRPLLLRAGSEGTCGRASSRWSSCSAARCA